MNISGGKRFLVFLGIATVIFVLYFTGPEDKYEDLEQETNILQILQQRELYRSEFGTNLSFVDVMKTFPWLPFKAAVSSKNYSELERYATALLLKLVPFLIRLPTMAANESCGAPLFQMPAMTDACTPLQNPRKVGILWQFGFDVDALEIHLNELDILVNKFFIIESAKAHSRFIQSKPLIWDRLRYDKRFVRFSPKIVHFVVDDASLVTNPEHAQNMWGPENVQELLRWQKFLEWNNITKYFSENDLLGFGDVDEIPIRDDVIYLKNCELPSDSVDIGIWFPYDGINTVFTTDFPVKGHQKTLGDPTFWTLATARKYWKDNNKPPSRMRGKSEGHLFGGMHLSRYAYPPFQLAKMLTASEADLKGIQKVIEVGMLYSQNKSEKAEAVLNNLPRRVARKIQNLKSFRKWERKEAEAIVKMPWFLKCNLRRFPGFDKLHDSRLDAVRAKETYKVTNETIGLWHNFTASSN